MVYTWAMYGHYTGTHLRGPIFPPCGYIGPYMGETLNPKP